MKTLTFNGINGEQYTIDPNDEIARGGEGSIYQIKWRKNEVGKLFHNPKSSITQAHFNYLQKLDKQHFIKPTNLLFHSNSIAGYAMPYLNKNYKPLNVLFSKTYCNKNLISDQFKQKLAQKLLNAVESAHQLDIQIGDLNPFNIFFNSKGIVKLIDTDSYQSPEKKHNGLLLEDITDFTQIGIINESTDYYAMAVLIFNILTYTHPYKGIHQKLPRLGDRVFQKIPIFSVDPDLKAPKCYQPILDTELQKQFNRIFSFGERFKIKLSGKTILQPQKIAANQPTYSQAGLQIRHITSKVLNIKNTKQQLIVETEHYHTFYNASQFGMLQQQFQLAKSDWTRIITGQNNCIGQHNGKWWWIKSASEWVELSNFPNEKDAYFVAYDTVLAVLTENALYEVQMDKIFNSHIQCKRTEVFAAGFSIQSGSLVQFSGGVRRIFYENAGKLVAVKTAENIKQIFQSSQFACIQFTNKQVTKTAMVKFTDFTYQTFDLQIDNITEFAVKIMPDQTPFLFVPTDEKLTIYETTGFKSVMQYKVPILSAQSKLVNTRAGILALENGELFLLNS